MFLPLSVLVVGGARTATPGMRERELRLCSLSTGRGGDEGTAKRVAEPLTPAGEEVRGKRTAGKTEEEPERCVGDGERVRPPSSGDDEPVVS